MKTIWKKVSWAIGTIVVFLFTACKGPTVSEDSHLKTGNWDPYVYEWLVNIVEAGRDSGKIVIFDWDNTTQARDVGAATFAQAVADGVLSVDTIPPGISPAFTLDGQLVTPSSVGLVEYANKLGKATSSSGINLNAWKVQAWADVSLETMIEELVKAYDNGAGSADIGQDSVTTISGTNVARPFLYPDMVDLYGYLLSRGYDVWVVSAGPVWEVRWMVQNVMNPILAKSWGEANQLELDRVIGMTTLLQDNRTGELTEEGDLLADSAICNDYLKADPAMFSNYKLTSQILYPATYAWGKPAVAMEHITLDPPYLTAGDSSGDFGLFARGMNRLWVAVLSKQETQKEVLIQIDKIGFPETWVMQPTLAERSPGFVPDKANLNIRIIDFPLQEKSSIQESVDILIDANKLPGW